jgi:hypothetical protein
VGCAACIVHSEVQTSADILPLDIENVVNKIFQYFHICTVRVEELKEFCTFVDTEYRQVLGSPFVDTEYRQVLGSVKTRWLSLEPAVDMVIEMSKGLKSYFFVTGQLSYSFEKLFFL